MACNVLSKFLIERCFSRCLSPVRSNSTGRDWQWRLFLEVINLYLGTESTLA